MRNITVKREKTYVGCLAKIKLYISDPEHGELTIMGTPCRLLGTLKNGEEKTFAIGTEETTLYAIGDAHSKDWCNDSYRVSAGNQDLHISGRCQFSLGSNAFCFAGQDTPEKLQARKKRNRKSLWIYLAFVAVGLVAGRLIGNAISDAIFEKPAEEKVFAVEDMRITLTDDFEIFENDRFTGALASQDVGVTILKEPFRQVPGSQDISLEEYGHLVITSNGITGTMLCTEDGLTFFEFSRENQETGQVFTYFAAVYKTADAFWLVQIGVIEAEYSDWQPILETYARSVTFG